MEGIIKRLVRNRVHMTVSAHTSFNALNAFSCKPGVIRTAVVPERTATGSRPAWSTSQTLAQKTKTKATSIISQMPYSSAVNCTENIKTLS